MKYWREQRPSQLLWVQIEYGPDHAIYRHVTDGITVIVSGETHESLRWIHVSLSRRDRLPSWDDVKLVKSEFIGKNSRAFQILPPEEEYVNLHQYCLHLWHCVDKDVLPDSAFTAKG